jgi:hypothetical protein
MKTMIRLICLWGLGDALFLAVRPSGWGRFWTRGVSTISGDQRISIGMACLQVAICVWMIKKTSK